MKSFLLKIFQEGIFQNSIYSVQHYCKPHTHDSPWKAHDIKNLEKQYNIMNPPKGKQKRGRKKKASSKKQSKKQTNDGTRRARNRR